jgi:hypothetical protein
MNALHGSDAGASPSSPRRRHGLKKLAEALARAPPV